MNEKRFLDEQEAAEWLGVSIWLLRKFRYRTSGEGPVVTRIGGTVRYDLRDLEEFVQESKRAG